MLDLARGDRSKRPAHSHWFASDREHLQASVHARQNGGRGGPVERWPAVLGLGSGWQENEHTAYGFDFFDTATRLARLDEACAVIRSLLTEHRTTFKGQHYHLGDAPLEPKPAQSRLPILIGGGGERVTLRIAARWADEWNTWGTPDLIAAKTAVLDQHCALLDRDPREIRRSAQVAVFLDGVGDRNIPPVPSVTADVGQMQAYLQRYEDAGVNEFILPDWNLGLGQARLDVLDRFLTDVAAPFRDDS